jgi:hypothetical protein
MLDRDEGAQYLYRKSWGDLRGKKDGYDGALAGRGNQSLKEAASPGVALEKAKSETLGGVIAGNAAPADASSASAILRGGMSGKSAPILRGTAGEVQTKLAAVEQDTRWVNGKTFTQNGANWSDTEVQSVKSDARRNRVQFASKDYFDLLAGKPESAQWLALGRNVRFTIGDELYEIYE